jgi:hypothetical protein
MLMIARKIREIADYDITLSALPAKLELTRPNSSSPCRSARIFLPEF